MKQVRREAQDCQILQEDLLYLMKVDMDILFQNMTMRGWCNVRWTEGMDFKITEKDPMLGTGGRALMLQTLMPLFLTQFTVLPIPFNPLHTLYEHG